MSQSYLVDVEKMLGKEGAEEYLKELNYDPLEGIKKQVKAMFSFLQDNDIVEILKKYNNSMEDAFEELMDRNTHLEEEKKRERQLQEQKIREQQNERYIDTFVRNFQMFDKKEIEEIFKKNNNDPQLTSKQLYQMMKEREQKNEGAKKMQREMEIQNLYTGFSLKFEELSKEEITEVIVQNDLNVDVIAFELGKMQKQKIFDDLFIQFHAAYSSGEIRKVLDEVNWSKANAIKLFQLKQKELELQKLIELQKQDKNVQAPKLEYDEKQVEELKKESVFKVVDVKKIIQDQNEKDEDDMRRKIEILIINHSEPESPQTNDSISPEEHSITVTVEETKILAQIVLKGQTNYSWVGFFNKNDDSANYKNYNYLCKLSDSTFVVEKPLLNGIYHFRVFSGKYSCVKTSEDIVINKEDKVTMVRDEKNDKVINVTWQLGSVDPYAVSAYVTVHKKEEERPNYYRRWNWIKTFNGTHTFKTPIHTGEYEARVYFSGKLQFKSDLLIIEGI